MRAETVESIPEKEHLFRASERKLKVIAWLESLRPGTYRISPSEDEADDLKRWCSNTYYLLTSASAKAEGKFIVRRRNFSFYVQKKEEPHPGLRSFS